MEGEPIAVLYATTAEDVARAKLNCFEMLLQLCDASPVLRLWLSASLRTKMQNGIYAMRIKCGSRRKIRCKAEGWGYYSCRESGEQ